MCVGSRGWLGLHVVGRKNQNGCLSIVSNIEFKDMFLFFVTFSCLIFDLSIQLSLKEIINKMYAKELVTKIMFIPSSHSLIAVKRPKLYLCWPNKCSSR